jgi:hypothetical protein
VYSVRIVKLLLDVAQLKFSTTEPSVDTIVDLVNGNKENDGLGSLLYLWSGTSTYSSLAAETYTCSVETDCDDTISVISQIIQYKYVVCLFKEYFQFLNKLYNLTRFVADYA